MKLVPEEQRAILIQLIEENPDLGVHRLERLANEKGLRVSYGYIFKLRQAIGRQDVDPSLTALSSLGFSMVSTSDLADTLSHAGVPVRCIRKQLYIDVSELVANAPELARALLNVNSGSVQSPL